MNDLSKGFTVPQVAQKHDWPEAMVWSQASKGKDDQARFKELNWGIRTWYFNDCENYSGMISPVSDLKCKLIEEFVIWGGTGCV